jgi:hypothetical protein
MKSQHLSTDTPSKSNEDKLDKQLQDSFPTSDPPSHSPGAAGAPASRESKPVTASDQQVKDAEKKVRTGEAAKPHSY